MKPGQEGLAAREPRTVVPVCLHVLGRFAADRGGTPIEGVAWGRRSARAVLKLLAVEPGHRLHREQIQHRLWPDADPETADNNLHKALHAARHALEPERPGKAPSSYVRWTDSMVTLVPNHVWIDADHFEQLARDALGDPEPKHFLSAINAYPGDVLPEDRYEEWADARRDELIDLYQRVLLGLADLLERRGDYADGLVWLRKAAEVEPTSEVIQRGLIRLYALSGRRHRALRQYERCRQVLRDEVGVEPESATVVLYERVLAGDLAPLSERESGPPLASTATEPRADVAVQS